jgi:phosphonate transport system substrate-binding protein
MSPRALFVVLLPLVLITLSPAAGASDRPALRVAVVPYLTTSVLLKLFEPIRAHLEGELKRPVELYTAPDIRTHVRRIQKPDFDAVITAAHMGRLAQLDAGYVPVAGFESPLKGIITVHKESAIRDISELKGKTLSVNDRLLLVSIVTLQDLRNRGLRFEDVRFVSSVTQNSSLLSVARGDVDAAITAIFTLNQIPEAQRQDIRTIYTTDRLPNVMFLANPRLSAAERDAMRRALTGFGRTPAGEQFFATSGYNGIVPLDDAYMKTIDIYIPETRRILASGG